MPNKPSDDDINFFRAQMRNVKPLDKSHTTKINTKQPAPPLKKKSIAFDDNESSHFEFSDYIQETVTADTKLYFAQSGVQAKTLLELRQGKIRQTQILDLHGSTINEARDLLSKFLEHCIQNHQRCVRIIHGRGKLTATPPVLKNHVNSWLQQYPDILAFCSAIPRDGGTGAVYVLLKRKTKE